MPFLISISFQLDNASYVRPGQRQRADRPPPNNQTGPFIKFRDSPLRNTVLNHHNLVARTAAALLIFLFLGVSARAQSPTPSVPVGNLAAYPTVVLTSPKPTLVWTIHLPADANAATYVHFIRQIMLADQSQFDSIVGQSGQTLSPLSTGPEGSRFELWTVGGSQQVAHLLDTTFFAPYVPTAGVTIRSEDPYSLLPRTRADRPFYVDVTVQGILTAQDAPDISKGVTLFQHAQSYGATGTGNNIDRNMASLISQSPITTNGTQTLTFALNSVPGVNRAKVRGEERFSVFSRADYNMPESVIDSKFIQIWPVADGTITGITQGQTLGAVVPEVTLTLNDLYPNSTTWAKVYKGSPQPGIAGIILPGTSLSVNESIPISRILKTSNYGPLLNSDGLWTMEVLTQTPFGIDRLAYVSFTVQGTGMALESWRQTHFGSTANSGDGADLNDFDKDGLANLIEFAFGFDPTLNSAGQLPASQLLGNNAVISFTQPDGVGGITYGAEWSTTLLPGGWNPIADTAVAPLHSFSVPIGANPKLYLRLRVTGQ